MARSEWNAEWIAEHKGSYVQWLWNRARHASLAAVLQALLLMALVCLMLLYPLAYVL